MNANLTVLAEGITLDLFGWRLLVFSKTRLKPKLEVDIFGLGDLMDKFGHALSINFRY